MASTFSVSDRAVQVHPVKGKEQVTKDFKGLNIFNLTGSNGVPKLAKVITKQQAYLRLQVAFESVKAFKNI